MLHIGGKGEEQALWVKHEDSNEKGKRVIAAASASNTVSASGQLDKDSIQCEHIIRCVVVVGKDL